MRNALTSALIFVLLAPPLSFAAEPARAVIPTAVARKPQPLPQSALSTAIDREVSRLVHETSLAGCAVATVRQPQSRNENWIERHPALFGALVGAGGGALMSVTMENELFCSGGDEDCFFHGDSRVLVGAGIGAGVGALVGFLIGLGGD